MNHAPEHPALTAQHLSHALIEAASVLGLVRAEVGRILGFRCAQFTALFEGETRLEPDSHAWRQAEMFVQFYRLLHTQMNGERRHMIHWLRRHHPSLDNAPFYLLVDEGRVADLISYLHRSNN